MTTPATPTDPAPAAAPPRRPVAWRFLLGVLLAVLLLFGWYYLRGTWATANPTDPATPDQGVVSRLVASADGGRDVRTAVVIPVPVETAWKILSNYDEWERLFKTVRRKQVAEPLDAHRQHVVTDVMTPMGTLTLDFVVHHEPTADGGYLATWDAPVPQMPVNRGSIRITPQGPDRTLLVYTVRKQYRQYPQFFVNNSLLDQQKDLVRTLARRMVEIAREP
jgi:hypothetical protein